MKSNRILFVIILIILAGGVWYLASRNKPIEPISDADQDRTTVLVYFLDNNNPATTTSCGITRAVPRKIGKSDNVYKRTLEELFKGPTSDEKAEGLTTAFSPMTEGTNTKPLDEYFNTVAVKDGVAYVDFDPEALSYLNSAVCMQEAVKQPLENTLKQFTDVEQVEYMIHGQVFRDWDA